MNRTLIATTVLALALVAGAPVAYAQDSVDLPAICTADSSHAGMAMGGDSMGMAMATDEAHTDLMDGMTAMNRDMTAGGTVQAIASPPAAPASASTALSVRN